MGRIACAMRGPRSRAGLIAYPVGPPSDIPIPQTRLPARYGPSPAAGPAPETRYEKIASLTKTSTKVSLISLNNYVIVLWFAGALRTHPGAAAASGRSLSCGEDCG